MEEAGRAKRNESRKTKRIDMKWEKEVRGSSTGLRSYQIDCVNGGATFGSTVNVSKNGGSSFAPAIAVSPNNF